MRHIIPISGKDSAATAIVQQAIDNSIKYEYVFNPTGSENPAVYEWLDKVSNYLGKPIEYVGKPLVDVIQEQKILPSQNMRFCTKYSKIFPLRDWVGKDECKVYYGLRADEPERIGHNGSGVISPQFPLREVGIGLPGVWRILEDRDLLPPFFKWNRLYDDVKNRMGHNFSIVETLDPWHFRSLFSWRSREFNCSVCIFMRQYEAVGLYEHHPEIFKQWAEIEQNTGASDFTLQSSNSLYQLLDKQDRIFERRVKQVINILYKLAQTTVFKNHQDLLSVTSCGLYCGK